MSLNAACAPVGACKIEGQLTSMDACAAGRAAWLKDPVVASATKQHCFSLGTIECFGLSLARLPAELKHISKRRKRK